MSAWSGLLRAANDVRSRVRTASDANANDGANPPAQPAARERRGLGWFRRAPSRERSRWARRALDWPLVNYLEGAVWLGVAVTLGVSYYGSYDNLVEVLMAVGYAVGPAHVVPVALDAPLTVSVIGQFLLARWKSPPLKRWRLFAVTIITAPLSLAGNALRGAVVVDAGGQGRLDLALLDLHRPEVWIRLIAAMVPSIGVILAVAVTELVLREHARLEELREGELEGGQAGDRDSHARTPRSRRRGAKAVDPRVLRAVRAGGDCRRVATTAGLS